MQRASAAPCRRSLSTAGYLRADLDGRRSDGVYRERSVSNALPGSTCDRGAVSGPVPVTVASGTTAAQRPDGGRNALCGFLYQLVGTPALSVAGHLLHAGDHDVEAVLRVTGAAALAPEKWDQDAVAIGLEPGVGNALIQFKWSANSDNAIPPAEFKEICGALAASAARAAADGVMVDTYVLVSNRTLSPQSGTALENARNGKKSRAGWAADAWEVLKRLRLYRGAGVRAAYATLERFAVSLGCDAHEVSAGMDAIVGAMVRAAAGGVEVEVTTQFVASNLLGVFDASTADDPGPLKLPAVRRRAAAAVAAFANTYRIGVHGLIRRDLVRRIADAVEQSAVVVVTGQGGDGKTVALWQWAAERTSSTGGVADAFTGLTVAGDLSPRWPALVLANWAGASSPSPRWPHDFPSTDIVKRVRAANAELAQGDPRPAFALAVDGVDEAKSDAAHTTLRRLISNFAEMAEYATARGVGPAATLVLTCRDRRDLDEWIQRDISGGAPNPSAIALIEVPAGEFSVDELRDISEAARPGQGWGTTMATAATIARAAGLGGSSVAASIGPLGGTAMMVGPSLLVPQHASYAGNLQIGGSSSSDKGVLGGTSDAASAPALASVAVAGALLHPAMWRAFCDMNEADQDFALADDLDGRNELARRFLAWFLRKAKDRKGPEWRSPQLILPPIREVALATLSDPGLLRSMQCWTGTRSPLGGPPLGPLLYEELRSSGVVVGQGASWAWRHWFVAEYLASDAFQSDLFTNRF